MKNQKNLFDTLYSKPSIIWKNFFNKFLKGTISRLVKHKNTTINLGVDDGFEIPLFLSSN